MESKYLSKYKNILEMTVEKEHISIIRGEEKQSDINSNNSPKCFTKKREKPLFTRGQIWKSAQVLIEAPAKNSRHWDKT